MTETDALSTMRACHRRLVEEVDARVATLRTAVAGNGAYDEEANELASFLADEVLPHAAAEELTLYRTASTRTALALPLKEMTSEHRRLASLVEGLCSATSGLQALSLAEQVIALLEMHLDKEDGQLLARLYHDGRVNLRELVVDVRYATNRIRSEPPGSASGALGTDWVFPASRRGAMAARATRSV